MQAARKAAPPTVPRIADAAAAVTGYVIVAAPGRCARVPTAAGGVCVSVSSGNAWKAPATARSSRRGPMAALLAPPRRSGVDRQV